MKKRKEKLSNWYKNQIMTQIFSMSQKDIGEMAMALHPLKVGDKLIIESNNPNDPQIALNAWDNHYEFAYGYMRASLFLLNVINFGQRRIHKDSYIYPAIFCFRMYLEIIMKLIIQELNTSNGIELNIEGHNLIEKWNIIKGNDIITIIDEEVKAVENILNGLSAIDPMGTLFRFPKRLNNEIEHGSTLNLKTKFINVTKMKERFLQLYRFFEGLYDSVNPDNF